MRIALLALSAAALAFLALHHGSYSLLDRQQAAAFLWVAIAVAAVFGLLPAVRPPRRLLWPLLALGLLAAWTLLSLSWTESSERTFNELARIVGYLGVFVTIWIGVGRRSWRLVAAGLLTAGVLVCALAVASRFWPAAFPADSVARNIGTSRLNYPFGYWNAVGCWAAMTVTLCLAYAAHARSNVVRGLALAAVPLCSLPLYLSLSRAGFGGLAIGVVVAVAFAGNRWLTFIQAALAAAGSLLVILVLRRQPELTTASGTDGVPAVLAVLAAVMLGLACAAMLAGRNELGERLRMPPRAGRRAAIAGGAVAALVIVAAAIGYGGAAWDEFSSDYGRVADTRVAPEARLAQLSGNRHNLWDSAWHAFTTYPVAGTGPGTFEFWWSRNGSNAEFVRDVHNIYLEALAESGVIGLVLLLAFFAGLAWCGIAAHRELRGDASGAGVAGGLIAVFAVFLFQAGFDWMWESTAVAVFALAAIATASAARSERSRRGSASASIGLLLTGLLAVVLLLPGLASQRQIDKSQAAYRADDAEGSLAAAADAISAESWSATAYGQRAQAELKLGRLSQAQDSIDAAAKKEPYNWRWPLIATQVAVARGEPQLARRQLARARALRPYSPLFRPKEPAAR